MKIKLMALVIFLFSAQILSAASESLIDFRLSYPFLKFRDDTIRVKQRNYVGVDLTYQYYFKNNLGFFFSPVAWFVPLKTGDSSRMLYHVGLQGGPAVRFVPDSFFAPCVYGFAGVGASDARGIMREWNYPVGVKASINLYRQQDLFQDNALALTAMGTAAYHFGQLSILSPWYYDVGLALRGSF